MVNSVRSRTIISERRVGTGIRLTLLTQAKRLQWLAERRALGAPDAPDDDNGAAA